MKLFNSITATALITALGMAWSSQAYSELYTIHKVSNFTTKFDRQAGGSIEKENVKKKDTLEFLLNGESSKKRILVAIVECDGDGVEELNFEFGVWDKSDKELVETDLLEWSVRKAVMEMKGSKLHATVQADNEDDQGAWAGLFDNFDQDLEFQGRIVYRDLKSKLIPGGFNGDTFCVHTIKSFSMGDDGEADDGGTTDNVVTGGKLKINKPIAAVELFD